MIGETGLAMTPICFGASRLGDRPDNDGVRVDEARARATLRAIFDGSVNALDTSNNYGDGQSEERIGAAIAERGGLPEGFVLSTKLDRDPETRRFDADRARRSVEESLTRLGLDSIPLLHLHDPEHARDLGEITGEGGALDTLFRLKEEGIAKAVGLAMGRIEMMFPILRANPFDALISHNRYSLLNRSADAMFDYAFAQGVAILDAAPYAGGILAKGSAQMQRVTYQAASETALAHIRTIEDICARHDVAPGALALQFSMKDPRLTSTIVGVSRSQSVAETLDWAMSPIPQAAWEEAAGLHYDMDDPEANRVWAPS